MHQLESLNSLNLIKLMSNAKLYFDFLIHIEKQSYSEANHMSLRLLESIALAHADGQVLTVTKAMGLASIASPATIRRKLLLLEDLELVKFTHLGSNRRTKYLVPTPKTVRYFESLGHALIRACSLGKA